MRICTFSFFSDLICESKSLLDMLEFRRIFKTQSHAPERKKNLHVQKYNFVHFLQTNIRNSSEYPDHLSAFCHLHFRVFFPTTFLELPVYCERRRLSSNYLTSSWKRGIYLSCSSANFFLKSGQHRLYSVIVVLRRRRERESKEKLEVQNTDDPSDRDRPNRRRRQRSSVLCYNIIAPIARKLF